MTARGWGARDVASVLLVAAALGVPASNAAAQRADAARIGAAQTTPGRPALQPLRIGGELLAGSYAGVGGYVLGRALGHALGGLLPRDAESARDRLAASVAVAGAAVGTAGGVFAVGVLGDQGGDFATTLLGTGLGWGVGALASKALDRSGGDRASSRRRWLLATLEAVMPAVGATIAFNSTRRLDP